MSTVLITGVSGIVGHGCLRSFRQGNKDLKLIGTSIYDDYMPQAFCNNFEKAVPTDDENYFDWLKSIIEKYSVDLLVPGIECDVYKWNKNRDFFMDIDVKVVLNSENLIELCKNKWEFYEVFEKQFKNYAIPTCCDNNFEVIKKKLGLPFIIKPKMGYSSKGFKIINNIEGFKEVNNIKDNIFQQYIENDEEEYSVGAFFNRKSLLCAHIILKRKLGKQGYTEYAESLRFPQISKAVQEIGAVLKPVGPTNFQFRIKDGEPKLMEINPRIPASASIRSCFNFNECKMCEQFYLFDEEPVQPMIKSGKAKRYIEDFVIYDGNYI